MDTLDDEELLVLVVVAVDVVEEGNGGTRNDGAGLDDDDAAEGLGVARNRASIAAIFASVLYNHSFLRIHATTTKVCDTNIPSKIKDWTGR